MTNALALAYAVQDASDIPQALRSWEQQHRPVTEITQRWAVLYTVVSVRWPDNLLDLRSAIVSEAFASPNLLEHFLSAARHVVGAQDLHAQDLHAQDLHAQDLQRERN